MSKIQPISDIREICNLNDEALLRRLTELRDQGLFPKRGEYASFELWLSYQYLAVVRKTKLKTPTRTVRLRRGGRVT